jgi:hypothetical protein
MSTAIIKIAPVTVEITDLKIHVEYVLNAAARIHYTLLHANGTNYEYGTILLTEEEFAAWGTDDSYVEDLILNKLNLQRA